MIRFAWNQAGYLVEGLHRSFALGLTGFEQLPDPSQKD